MLLDTPDDNEPEIPNFTFHVAYGAPTNGKLYKELATKGFYLIDSVNRRILKINFIDVCSLFYEHFPLGDENKNKLVEGLYYL